MRKLLYILVLLLILISCNKEIENYGFPKNSEIKQDIYSKYLIENNIPIISDEKIEIFGKVTDENIIGFIELLLLKMDIVKNNIKNANNTKRTNSGIIFQSKTIVIVSGKPIIELEKFQSSFVYEPLHEDSIKEGTHMGYVEYPNVSIISEIIDLINANYILEIFVEKINENGKKIPINYHKILNENNEFIDKQIQEFVKT